ncbi:MAG: aspartate--tRNA ligase [Chitinophagales bacterium]|nr:aspartate--tRNA ligase [Chitinophagales bacterium]MCZ2394521.1 aspartate--tRNA ligase [Chitinophagales bacterium]
MYRSHNCGELNITKIGSEVILSGWVQRTRDFGGLTFLDLRDRYGITQIVFNMATDASLCEQARNLGREDVVQIKGNVVERSNKNFNIATGEIEITAISIQILSKSKTPPFTIENDTDGGDELRMQYRYLDLRRDEVRDKIITRHKIGSVVRNYLNDNGFLDIETPFLIKSTPEGARDFVVPSRINSGQFYALPQSPQTFKQLLMVSGFDKYYQIVRCFRDEDLRADRQPEFTQIDCEMSFVEQEDILNIFEGLIKKVFKDIKGIELQDFPRMTYDQAMELYGSDKPDIRFGMTFNRMNDWVQGKGFKIFDEAELVLAINVEGAAHFTRKQIDELTEWVKRPQIGATGLIYCRYNEDGSLKSSVDKFFNEEDLKSWADHCGSQPGDLILILSGKTEKVRKQMNELRLEMGNKLGLRKAGDYKCLWVLDFPLLEWDEDSQRWFAMHHPFTSPKKEDISKLYDDPGAVRADAYDLAINGVEVGGGSIRIFDKVLQAKMFERLGFTPEQAQAQFGFLMNAFEFGAPPHGGLAFGFDRLCAVLGNSDSIRDYIAFPKNNSGRDVMLDSPSVIDDKQLKELNIKTTI